MSHRPSGLHLHPHPLANSKAPIALVVKRKGRVSVLEVNPFMAAVTGVAAAVVVAGVISAGLYWTFRDSMVARYMSRQAEMQYAYEDRIAALRAQIDKVASRGLLNQDSVEAKIDDLLARQAKLESRQGIVSSLADMAGLPPPPKSLPSAFAPGQLPRTPAAASAYAPLDAQGRARPLPDDGKPRPADVTGALRGEHGAEQRPVARISATVGEIENALGTIEKSQMATLTAAEQKTGAHLARLREVISAVGLTADRFRIAAGQTGDKGGEKGRPMGGPYIPLPGNSPFDRQVNSLRSMLSQSHLLTRVVDGLPLKRPLAESYGITSPFGVRVDPFLGTHALHSGTDFRAPIGTQVRPTAPGKVTEAGWAGGYGNMVEVDHGFGVVTRYAHLSAILAQVGDTVGKDTVIGRVGTTGRSTGAHLHYEVRIDGEPVDPMRFIKPGQLLASR